MTASQSIRKMLSSNHLMRVALSALLPAVSFSFLLKIFPVSHSTKPIHYQLSDDNHQVALPAHIYVLWRFWQSYSRYVDKRVCSCSCWDTVYKGPYESGVASYKHMYFNATRNSVKMWILVVVGVIALYETTKYVLGLMSKRKLRYDFLILFASSIFSHYYAWWAYLNYYNDEFYSQFNHQSFFTVS